MTPVKISVLKVEQCWAADTWVFQQAGNLTHA